MSATRAHRDYLYYLIYGSGYIDNPWSGIWGRNDYANDHWQLFVRPTPQASNVGLVDMSNHDVSAISIVETQTYRYNGSTLTWDWDAGVQDMRTADRLTLDHHGVGPETSYKLALLDVEFVDAPVDQETHLQIITKDGFTTDGTLASITMHVGNQEMIFTGAARDSTIFMGSGYDKIDFRDHLDVPGHQYWSVIRRPDGELDVYSLFSGYRVQLGGGYKGWTAGPSDLMNYGEIEEITLKDARLGGSVTYYPGVDLPDEGERGSESNIDLRGDGKLFSDSFNLAYFNFIRYTSQNVWVGEATIHDGARYSTPSDRTVTTAKYGVDAPILPGTMSVIGQSRNGTHDLIVGEQAPGEAIDGRFRLYAFDVDSGMYNEFNQVFLGTSAPETNVDKSGIVGTDWQHRVALYGFGGNDVLKGGAGNDYIFGGQSVYDLTSGGATGNEVWGGLGADYFGVGSLGMGGQPDGYSLPITSANGVDFLQGYATDVIMDWHAGEDTLVVLANGVAVIGGLRDGDGLISLSADNFIDLRDYPAIATSDQDGDGARGGSVYRDWDANPDLNYIYDNQQLRDENSIKNENDRTVVNQGLVVVRGLEGNDTIIGSAGNDYLYGNAGQNVIDLSEGGADRVYIDAFHPSSAFVRGFSSDDKIYLNEEVIEAFAAAFNSTLALEHGAAVVTSGYTSAISYDPNVNFMHSTFYNRLVSDPATNPQHLYADGSWNSFDQSADSITFGIGVGMVVAGTAMIATGILAVPGEALRATGVVLGGLGAAGVVNTQAHQNATISGRHDHFVNIMNNNHNPFTTIAGSDFAANKEPDSLKFLDFFANTTTNDGFTEVLEFTDAYHVSNGVFGYFAVTSNVETFVYLVASSDNLVTNNEAIRIAEINGTGLTAANFESYIGAHDIYNQATVAPIKIVTPSILRAENDEASVSDGGSTVLAAGDNLDIVVDLPSGATAGSTIQLYDGLTAIGSVVGLTEGQTSVTLSDIRGLGTTVLNSTNATNGNDTYFLRDSEMTYRVELVDGITGIATRSNSFSVTVAGGDAVIDGGSGDDILILEATSDYLNGFAANIGTADGKLSGIETIVLNSRDGVTGISLNLSGQSEGFTIGGSEGADTIISGYGADEIVGGGGSDTFKYTSHLNSTWSQMDVIKDFVFGASGDKLDLSAIDGAGDVGYSTQVFASLAGLTNYAKSDLTILTGGDALEVFVGLVSNSSNASENGAFVLARSDDMRNWTTSDNNSTIIKLDGVTSLSGIAATNFVDINDFYNVTTVVIGSSPNTTNLTTNGVTGASGLIVIGDTISGLTEVSKQLVASGIKIPSNLNGYGDDIVHDNQFEVYYGTYSSVDQEFTVTATRFQPSSPIATYGTSAFKTAYEITHTMVLYDNQTSDGNPSGIVEGFFVEGFFPEEIGGNGNWLFKAIGTDKFLYANAEVL